MYSDSGRSGSACSRYMSWATRSLAAVSSMGLPRKTIRSDSSLEYGSSVRVPVAVRSVNSGRTYRAEGER